MEIWNKIRVSLPRAPRVDIPEFTRCCLCLPLRHGLLVWGYFKAIAISYLAFLLIGEQMRSKYIYVTLILVIVFLMVEILFTLLFIVAGHLKHEKLYFFYYKYSIGLLVVHVTLMFWFVGWNWIQLNFLPAAAILQITLQIVTFFLPIIIIQTYVTLLVRTEARKLVHGTDLEFVNHVATSSSIDAAHDSILNQNHLADKS